MAKLTPDYIRDKLLELGFSPANKGFQYIAEAVMILENDPDAAFNTIKGIYLPIAKEHGVTHNATERCIRNAVKLAMECNADRISDYLRFQPTGVSGSYKNSDFLAAFHMALHRG